MYKREKDVNYQVLKGVSTDEIVQSLEEADSEAAGGPTKPPLLQQLRPKSASQQTRVYWEPALFHTVLWAFTFTPRAYSPETPRKKIHNFLPIVPFYKIVFVSSSPRKFEMSLTHACVHGCMQTASCFKSRGLAIQRAAASILNTTLSLCCEAKKKV